MKYPYNLKTLRNQHALYNIHFHIVLVTKDRKPCLSPEIFDLLKAQAEKVFGPYHIGIEEMSHGDSYVHFLLSVPPSACISSIVNSYKSSSSRMVRKEFADDLARYFAEPVFWDRSYLIVSAGDVPDEVIGWYLGEQKPEENGEAKGNEAQQHG